jgi:pheromone shutdown-related protein TraB
MAMAALYPPASCYASPMDAAPAAPSSPDGPDSVTVLVDAGTTYTLIGTAHVSERSVAEVREVIAREKPEVVCVELDKQRYEALTQDTAFRNLDVFKVIREGKSLYLLAHLALTSYQRRMGAALGVKPGSELLAAVDAARATGSRVELVDRDINITLKRTWANVGLWKRSMLLSSLLVGFGDDKDAEPVTKESIEKLKEQRALSEMLTELSKAMPEVKVPLIDERDEYLADSIRKAGSGASSVVAVVGAAHVPGIKAHWGRDIDRAKLEKLPPPSKLWTAVKWLIPILFLVALVWGWRSSNSHSLYEMMVAWIAPTSIGAGVMTLLGGGHLLTILTALVVAPVCAIHPLLGTAMFTGLVEAWLRKPSVGDCERLPDDIQSLRGFWRNPVTRILLIAILSGLGTAIGFWIGVGWVASLL